MKHLKNLQEYMSNINEGVNYNNAVNADIQKVGRYQTRSKDAAEIEEAGKNFLASVKPFALTGDGKTDVDALIKFCVAACKSHKVDLDAANTEINSDDYDNELLIPVKGLGEGELFLRTSCSYMYLSGLMGMRGKINLNAFFYSKKTGDNTAYSMDLADQASIKRACDDFNKWREDNFA